MCIFKALHEDDPEGQRQYLTRKEFRRLYEVRNLRWKPVHVCSCYITPFISSIVLYNMYVKYWLLPSTQSLLCKLLAIRGMWVLIG